MFRWLVFGSKLLLACLTLFLKGHVLGSDRFGGNPSVFLWCNCSMCAYAVVEHALFTAAVTFILQEFVTFHIAMLYFNVIE